MNISNMILRLQKIIDDADSSLDYQILSKVIEKLKVGKISVVATFDDLPSNLKTDVNLILVEDEEELYYNIGNLFFSLDKVIDNFLYSISISNFRLESTSITNWSQAERLNHFLGITDDDIAWAWGSNDNGQLGISSTDFQPSPVNVVGGLAWKQVSAGSGMFGAHSLGITTDGIAYAWGNNQFGQLGAGTMRWTSSPVTVIGGITNWKQVCAGPRGESAGVTEDGFAYEWGDNGFRPVTFDGSTTPFNTRSAPVQVIGGINNWTQISIGSYGSYRGHTLGLTDDGIAWAWGINRYGQFGNGQRFPSINSVRSSSPVTVIGGITNWSQVSAGASRSFGLTDDGIAYAWGWNGFGSLGDGTTIDRSSPVTIVGGITNWSKINHDGFALTDSGTIYGWGSNRNGRLSDGTTIDRSSPVVVGGGIDFWTYLSGDKTPLAISNIKFIKK